MKRLIGSFSDNKQDENTTELCHRQMSVHLASLQSIMDKECLQILKNLPTKQQATMQGCLGGL